MTSTNYLYELDRITQQVVQAVIDAQKLLGCGTIRVPHSDRPIALTRSVTVPELNRIRLQFLAINKINVITDIAKIGPSFTDYLNSALAE